MSTTVFPKVIRCPEGKAGANYSCRFCHVRLHGQMADCRCSTSRPMTRGASLCIPCATALDVLTNEATTAGKIHKTLVREARMIHMPSSD